MDETGAYYTEWSKPERKTPIQYTNAYTTTLFMRSQIKTTLRYHLTPVRMAIIQMSTNNKCRRGYGEKGALPQFVGVNWYSYYREHCGGSLFSIPSPAFIVCRLFDDGHSDWCEVISHCEQFWASFHAFVSHLYVFFGKMSVYVVFPLFDWVFFWHWVAWAASIVWKLILCQLFHLLLFPPILSLVFSRCL